MAPPLSIDNLTSNQTIVIKFPGYSLLGVPHDELSCIFWDVFLEDWNDFGCTKGLDSGGVFFCECSHLTSFSIGPFVISANLINPCDAGLLSQLLSTSGGHHLAVPGDRVLCDLRDHLLGCDLL